MPHSGLAADKVFGADGLAGEVRRSNEMLGISAPSTGIRLSRVQRRPVTWLWPGRIPRGKITVLDGDPGLGKSTITLDLAARVSRGLPMPDGAPGSAGGVVLANAEDDLGDTVRPRLDAAGADCERIRALPATTWLDISDTDTLRATIHDAEAALVVVDPLMAYLPNDANSWRDQDVRKVLAPLAALAAETGTAIVLVRHLRKAADGNPLYRGGGSIGIIGAARSGLLVARDPDNGDRRVLAVTKSNLAREAPSMSYQTTERDGAVRIEWLGASDHAATALLGQPATAQERGELAEAMDWLRQRLADGPVAARQIKRDARDAGLSERTLLRAKAALSVESGKCGFASGWQWALPKDANPPKDANIPELASFAETPVNTGVPPKDANAANIPPDGSLGSLRTEPRDLPESRSAEANDGPSRDLWAGMEGDL